MLTGKRRPSKPLLMVCRPRSMVSEALYCQVRERTALEPVPVTPSWLSRPTLTRGK